MIIRCGCCCRAWQVDELRRRLGDEDAFARLGEPDDLDPRVVLVDESKPLADRILTWPVMPGELLVDDGDARRVDGIIDPEVASLRMVSAIVSK